MKQHIVFVIGHYKNGGVAMRATNLANEFGKRGYRTTLLVTKEIGEQVFFERHAKVELICLQQFYQTVQVDPKVRKDRRKRENAMRSARVLRNFHKKGSQAYQQVGIRLKAMEKAMPLRAYAVLHPNSVFVCFGADYYESAFYAMRGLPGHLIYAERNAAQLEIPKHQIHREMFEDLLRQADGAVLQTQDEHSFYKDILTRNVEVIHNPIKPSLPQPYEGERRHVVVNFCRMAKQKNLPLMIDAFIKLHEDYPDYRLEIYGNAVAPNEEQVRDELRQSIETQGYGDCIAILPPTADVHERVRDAAMFVSSSDFEGLSNSMIEAMAIGLPCVCTDCLGGGAREVIRDGENGLLVPMQDADALYRGMKRFVEDPVFAELCGRHAATIREDLAVETIADKWLELMEKI